MRTFEDAHLPIILTELSMEARSRWAHMPAA